MNVLARFARWLREYRVTLCVVTITRGPASPAERDLRETAHRHNPDALRLLELLADGGLVLRRMGSILADSPRASPADAIDDDCRDPDGAVVGAPRGDREEYVRVPAEPKTIEAGEMAAYVASFSGPRLHTTRRLKPLRDAASALAGLAVRVAFRVRRGAADE